MDKIIDVIFTTAADVEASQEAEQLPSDGEGEEQFKQLRTDPEELNAKRLQAVNAFGTLKGVELLKRSRTSAASFLPFMNIRRKTIRHCSSSAAARARTP